MAGQERPTCRQLPSIADDWSTAKLIGFRFCFVYFVLYSFFSQIINSILFAQLVDVSDYATLWPVRLGVPGLQETFFKPKPSLSTQTRGAETGPSTGCLPFCLLAIAILAAAVWSVIDRKRTSYPVLSKWFELFLRVALVSQMFVYGFAKVVPLQIYFPFPFKFLEPLRDFSPMGLLWSSIGVTPAYEIFTGCAELTGAILLIFPRTVTLGALVCLADTIQVFVLNMTYDVCVKLLSLQLILMSLVLLCAQSVSTLQFLPPKSTCDSSAAAALVSLDSSEQDYSRSACGVVVLDDCGQSLGCAARLAMKLAEAAPIRSSQGSGASSN